MVKTPSSYIYNQFEKTLTVSQLSAIIGRISASSFEPDYLENPVELAGDLAAAFRAGLPALAGPVLSSTSAHFSCGCVHAGDLVMTIDRSVHEVVHFLQFEVPGSISVWALLKTRAHIGGNRYSTLCTGTSFAHAESFVAPLIWGRDGDTICIVPPPLSAVW